MYIGCSTSQEYKVKFEGNYGTEVSNVEAAIYVLDMNTGSDYYFATNSNRQPEMTMTGRSADGVVNSNQGTGDLKGQRLQSGHMYRIDMIYSGKFTGKRKSFGFQPKFFTSNKTECMQSNRLLIDYISYETEAVCVTPRLACVGDSVLVNTAGFPAMSNVDWYKKVGNNYVPIPDGEVSYVLTNGRRKQAYIKMLNWGVTSYRVQSSNHSSTYVDFDLTGDDCSDVLHPLISGTDPVCAGGGLAVTSQYFVTNKDALKFMDGAKVYHWTLTSPSGKDTSELITSMEGPEQDRIAITFPPDAEGSDSLNKPYIITMVPYVGGVAYEEYTVSKEIYLRKYPDLSGLTMETEPICPGVPDVTTATVKGIQSVLDQSNEYTYSWKIMNNTFPTNKSTFDP